MKELDWGACCNYNAAYILYQPVSWWNCNPIGWVIVGQIVVLICAVFSSWIENLNCDLYFLLMWPLLFVYRPRRCRETPDESAQARRCLLEGRLNGPDSYNLYISRSFPFLQIRVSTRSLDNSWTRNLYFVGILYHRTGIAYRRCEWRTRNKSDNPKFSW